MSGFLGRTFNKVSKAKKPQDDVGTQSRNTSSDGANKGSMPEARSVPSSEEPHSGVKGTNGIVQEQASMPSGQKPIYLRQPFVKTSLVKGSFRTIVALPKYIDDREWVAINLFDFFNNLNSLYNILSEECTSSRCSSMSAGPNFSFFWTDERQRNLKLPAPQYIDYVMSWVGGLVNNESTFPTRASSSFSPNFPSTCKAISRQLLRVFAHIYHAHYLTLVHLSAEGHFNSLFAHFVSFCREFDILEAREIISVERSGCAAWVVEAYQANQTISAL